MYKKIFITLIFALMLFSNSAYAQDLCGDSGYTVLFINGMFTNKADAISDSNKLKNLLPAKYKDEKIYVDFLYNPSHIGGGGDVADAILQSSIESFIDYDLLEMIDEASEKVKTKKVLLVGYSQGNFYANNFFDRVVDKESGVPRESISVYSVATPDDHVSKGGIYLTSDTDKVISEVVSYFKRVMPPNTHIQLKEVDGNGHSFEDVYLKYKSGKIVSDIKSSLERLKGNNVKDVNSVCISKQQESKLNNIMDSFLPAVDYIAKKEISSLSSIYKKVKSKIDNIVKIAKGLGASALLSQERIDTGSDDINDLAIKEENIINEEKESDKKIIEDKVDQINKDTVEQVLVLKEDEKIQIENESLNAKDKIDNKKEKKKNINSSGSHSSSVSSNNNTSSSVDNNESIDQEEETEDDTEDISGDEETDTTDNTYVNDASEAESFFFFEDSNYRIKLNGENIINLNVGDTYIEQGVKLLNKNDLGDITYYVRGDVDTSQAGVYIVRYYAYTNTPYNVYVIRIVNVVDKLNKDKDDKEPPVITLNGDSFVRAVRHTGGYIEEGATAVDNKDGDVPVVISSTYEPPSNVEEKIAYISADKSGNVSMKVRKVITTDYMYIPKYDFGTGNEDGRDWQAWFFNGSAIYDWSNKYSNNYLRQEFKIEAEPYPQFYCLNCIKRGIFTTNPLSGFNNSDYLGSISLEGNPQNKHDGQIYQVVIQWDEGGYNTKISHGDIVDSSLYTEVDGVNEEMWVGWCGTESSFRDFPMGNWRGINPFSQTGLEGGYAMVLMPYQVYNPNAVNDYIDDSDNEEDEDDDEGEVNEDAPIISSFTLNGNTNEITIDPKIDQLTINLTSDHDVEWVSLKIENLENSDLYKIYYPSGESCMDGRSSCSKVWDGELSGEGKTLINGVYKIKVHIKDMLGLEFEDYIDALINVIGH